MQQADLLDWKPPSPQTILGDRGGESFDHKRDVRRLNAQAQRIWDCMADGKWRSLSEIHDITGDREASISARLRDFRKSCFGCTRETMESVHVKNGLWRFRLHPEKRLGE